MLPGYTLKANFILIDAVDDQDFILGRTFLIEVRYLGGSCERLKLTIREPYLENHEAAILQVGNEPPVDVLVKEHVIIKTGETMMIKLQLRSEKCLKNRLMLLTQKSGLFTDRLFLGNTVVRVLETKTLVGVR